MQALTSSDKLQTVKKIDHEKDYHTRLLEQQIVVQQQKKNNRSLEEYNQYLFLSRVLKDGVETNCVEEFLAHNFGNKISSLQNLLLNLHKRENRMINWVDFGGGKTVAMREAGLITDLKGKVKMYNVDLIDHQLENLELSRTKPEFIQGNMESICLPKPADLITSIETIQYLNDPIRTICNAYNQLADHGFLIIAAEREFSDRTRFEDNYGLYDRPPLMTLLSDLKTTGVPHAVAKTAYRPEDARLYESVSNYRLLILQKVPSTYLEQTTSVVKIFENTFRFKTITYQNSDHVVRITNAEAPQLSLSNEYYQNLNIVFLGNEI